MSALTFLQIDFPSILLGALAAFVCGLWGNFLILRRQALLGDAISHVVLPGIVVGFLAVGGSARPAVFHAAMFLGALGAALLSVALIELIRRLGRVDVGAAMGVVFTSMFAAGVVLLEQSDASSVHLDVQHALYGNLESALWLDATGWSSLIDPAALALLPTGVHRLVMVSALSVALVLLFFKELRMACFDPEFADTVGRISTPMSLMIVLMTALAAVAAFDAVGSILVIAMFICPAATARLMTDRLSTQLWLSAAAAAASAVVGYALAAFAPLALGFEGGLSAAAMVATSAGAGLTVAMIVSARRRGPRAS